ncbi:MAG: PAS domain S-box protein, partial [Tepidiformaceae bacterium]
LDSTPDLISISSLDGSIAWANRAHIDVLHYAPEEMVGMSGLDLIHPEDRQRAADSLARLASGSPTSQIEARLRSKGGEWIHVELVGRILPGGKPRMVIVSRPLGERLEYVRLLRESEERFRTVVDTSPDLVSILDEDGRITFANASHVHRLGVQPAELLGRTAQSLVHPDDRGIAFDTFRRVAKDGGQAMLSVRLGHADGRWLPFDVAAGQFIGPTGAPGLVAISRDESAREAAMAELARLSTTLAVQQEHSPDGVLVVDEHQHAISYNSRFLELWSMPASVVETGLEGRTAHVIGQLADPHGVQKQLAELYADPQRTAESEVSLRDGRRLEMHTAPLVGPDATAYGRAWYYRDVTERKVAEEALRNSEERYRRLVELSPLTIAVHRAGKLLYINDAGGLLFGMDPQTLVGRQVFDLVHPEDHAAVHAAANRTESATGTKFVEARVLLPGGTIRHVELASGQTTYDGRPATQTVLRDITDRLVAEEAFRESEKRYRAVVESSPDAIVLHDGEVLLYANPAAALLAGAPDAASMIGHHWNEFLASPSPEALRTTMQRTAERRRFTVEEPRFLVKRNLTTQLEMSFAPTLFDGREALQVVIRDVSERRRAEQERLALERALLETQKLESLGVMAGGIAHDFNNLLVAIMGNAGLATMELPPGSPVQAYLHEIETASQRAADLARQMLAYSGKGQFLVSWTNLGDLVQEMGNLLQASLPRRVRLCYQLAPDLPQVKCDATQIRQIVMNLVINAAESIGDREGVITVTIGEVEVGPGDPAVPGEALQPGRHVFLDVSDTGAGMDEATRTRIFEPFFSTKFTGRGLGLAAVLGIARGHSGAIRVESEPGVGTTFRLLLPAREVGPTYSQSLAPTLAPTEVGGRVLVVDDEESVRRVSQSMLQRLGYEVIACRDGDEALAAVALYSNPYTVLLLDMLIPGSGGSDVLRRLRAVGTDCPVVLMSGYSEEEALHGLPEGTQAAFLQKPFTMAELKDVIETLLRNEASEATGT